MVDPLMGEALETRLKPHVSLLRMKCSSSNHSKLYVFSFCSHWVLCKLREQEDRLSLNLVLLAVPFRFLRCCCYVHPAQLNFFICKGVHDPW